MPLKTIVKSIDIDATAGKIWEVLFNEGYIKEWYTAFGDGIIANTDWKVGSKAEFKDTKGNGIFGRVVENDRDKYLAIEYDGIIVNGLEDFESEDAKTAKGARETYSIKPITKGSQLLVTCDMDDSMYDQMSACWENALKKIKSLAEQQ